MMGEPCLTCGDEADLVPCPDCGAVMDDERLVVTVIGIVRDEGAVVVFEGLNESGGTVTFALDHRAAQAVVDIQEGMDDDVQVEIEDWQLIGA